jgi:hypothetical protein
VAADVCAALGIANSRDALARLDDDEKGVVSTDTLGGAQQVAIINESGLYNLIMGSRKPQAKPFKRWVTGTVLPDIRKTGAHLPAGKVLRAWMPARRAGRAAPAHPGSLIASGRRGLSRAWAARCLIPRFWGINAEWVDYLARKDLSFPDSESSKAHPAGWRSGLRCSRRLLLPRIGKQKSAFG